MFAEKTVTHSTELEEAIARVLSDMQGVSTDSDDYAKLADQLIKLYKIKAIDVDLKIKEIENLVKQDEAASSYELKKSDAQTKTAENAANLKLKQEELQNRKEENSANHDLRMSELNTRKQEVAATVSLREAETDLKRDDIEARKRISMETLAVIGGNIVGIALILGFERTGIITSKALGFVTRSR